MEINFAPCRKIDENARLQKWLILPMDVQLIQGEIKREEVYGNLIYICTLRLIIHKWKTVMSREL